jgi:trehalose 6-phosphate phosphatase
MRYVLGRAGRRALAEIAAADVVVGLDFDGTLAPIVEQPEDARMRPRTRRLLAELARLYPCVVISGRARADTRAHLDGVEVDDVLGNHGNEPSPRAPRLLAEVRRWLAPLRERLAPLDGVEIEDKRYSLALHYRRAERPRAAERAIRRAVAAVARGARMIGGKSVVNVLPRSASDKGRALSRVREGLGCAAAIYIGDDDTDEDVFARRDLLLGVRVGRKAGSRADWYVRAQEEVDELLERLVRCRTPSQEEPHATNPLRHAHGARPGGLPGRSTGPRRTRPPGRRATARVRS